jgi:hypothetical protein
MQEIENRVLKKYGLVVVGGAYVESSEADN